MRNFGVHQTHCCILHGCKYGKPDCPVENKLIIQTYPCEDCDNAGIKTIQDLFEVLEGKKKTCPKCGYILK